MQDITGRKEWMECKFEISKTRFFLFYFKVILLGQNLICNSIPAFGVRCIILKKKNERKLTITKCVNN